jgi:hypothetical protein
MSHSAPYSAHEASHGMAHGHAQPSGIHAVDPRGGLMKPEFITLRPGAVSGASAVLILVGLVGLIGTLALGLVNEKFFKQALAAYHVGVMTSLAICLGATFFVMVFHLVGAGWVATIRRQFENVMSLLPIIALLVVPLLIIEVSRGGVLFTWMNKEVQAQDLLAQKKAGYLNVGFFMARALLYLVLWTFITRRLWWYSTEQDRTGDKWLTNRARFTCSWALPLFALSIAFAAFDWLMSLDYRFFSTMWGVYYFAGCAYVSVPVVVMVLALLMRSGKLQGTVTDEHIHDLAKLMFAFTVFWAYIGYSQYFLIWYSQIPEETQYFLARKGGTDGIGEWAWLSKLLVIGHFCVPFYFLLWRPIRRSATVLILFALWAVSMQALDMVWIVRPMVYPLEADPVKFDRAWLDVLGIVGALALFFGLLARKVASGPLIPLRDPRLPEALHHKNYV